jgi:hypothetical protein
LRPHSAKPSRIFKPAFSPHFQTGANTWPPWPEVSI